MFDRTSHRLAKIITSAALAAASMLLWTADLAAQAKTTNFKYDALGRLTYVEDGVNGNRDYDYDAAGNRLTVSVGTISEATVEPGSPGPFAPPPKPTGLTSQYMYDCAWVANWGPANTATSFKFKSTSTPIQTLPVSPRTANVFCDSGNPNSNKPSWVQACNALGCSDKVYFP